MAKFNINLAKEVYENTFGYFQVPKDIPENTRPDKDVTDFAGTELYKKDEYGRDVFSPVTLKWGDKEVTLPYSTVSLTGSKKIAETELVNRRGSVNEQININDYQLQINGVVISKERVPEKWLRLFNEIFETKEPIEIINPITDFYLKDNFNIIIKSHNIPDMRGVDYAQAFSFKAKTDTNLELIV